MQPMWLCILSGGQFEDIFENAQWRKVKWMQSVWFCNILDKLLEDAYDKPRKNKTIKDLFNLIDMTFLKWFLGKLTSSYGIERTPKIPINSILYQMMTSPRRDSIPSTVFLQTLHHFLAFIGQISFIKSAQLVSQAFSQKANFANFFRLRLISSPRRWNC